MTETSPTGTVVLAETTTSTERDIIDEWLANGGLAAEPGGAAPVLLDLSADAVTSRLVSRTDDPLVVPVRVLWLPKERDGVRRANLKDAVTLTNPRNPNRFAQRWIVRHAPDRHRVLTGEPALLSELRARHLDAGGDPAPRALARYIVRSAVLTLARAERTVIGDRYKVPRLVVEEIMDGAVFRKELDDIATRTGMSREETHERAEEALRELVATQSRLVADLFSQAMAPVHKRAWTVHADLSGLPELRMLNRRYPLVFLPSHRSYVDAFVLGDVLAQNDFPPNHLIGGANLNFWPLGPIARRTGTVFIRRSFGDDEIYKAVVEEYFAYLLSKRFNMEWYFEGGRTRTGKLRPPKYGLLNYLAEAVRNGRVDDVLLIPVAITYERLNELGAISSEQLGGKKQPEGLAWLAQYVRNQQNSAGHVYLKFGAPLYARERLIANGDVMAGSGDEPDDARSRLAVQKLAFEVAVGINNVTPIAANALVTLALLGVRGRALTVPEIQVIVGPVLRYIDERSIPKGELNILATRIGVTSVLDRLALAKVVTAYTAGEQAVYSIEPGQHLIAAFYRNSAIHWFVNRSLAELAIIAASERGSEHRSEERARSGATEGPAQSDTASERGSEHRSEERARSGATEGPAQSDTASESTADDPLAAGWAEAARVRDLLKFEFFFPDRAEWDTQMEQEFALIFPEWHSRTPTPDELLERLLATGFIMVHRTLRSFLGAQLVVAERLALRDPTAPIDKAEFMDECVRVGKQMLLQGRLNSPESVSSELFGSAYKLAEHRDLVQPGEPDLQRRRQAFAEELLTLRDRIDRAESLDAANRRVR